MAPVSGRSEVCTHEAHPVHGHAHTAHGHAARQQPRASSSRNFSREEFFRPRADDSDVRQSKLDNAKIGASKAIRMLEKMQDRCWCIAGAADHGELSVQTNSIYGAAIALPQVARSCDWPGTLTADVIRVYFFCIVNFGLQAFLLSMIGEEQHFWYPFAGQMHLCNFGASIQDCPDAPNCMGPGGTSLSYPRMYDYDIWSTRGFLKQSMQALFPHLKSSIDGSVDPGEYALENFNCRCLCIFLFMLAVVDDLEDAVNLCRTLAIAPTSNDTWITQDVPDWASKEDVKQLTELTEKDFIQYEVAGMPLHWKVFNACFILLPKCLLWLGLVRSGVHYLMETAGIVDVIVNAMALTFILQVDEIVFQRLSSAVTTEIMSKLNFKSLYECDEVDTETDSEALSYFNEKELAKGWGSIIFQVFPTRLFIIIVCQAVFLWDYYSSNCDRQQDGSWVSKAMHLPTQMGFHPIALMFGWEGEEESQPFWTMPS